MTTAPDFELGAFSDVGPWAVDPAAMPWLEEVGRLRAEVRREIPRALARPRVPPVARLLRIVGAIGGVLLRWYLRDRRGARSRAALSEGLRRAFERLGSTFIKLGQIISGGEGLFPEELVAQFRLLRDRVAPETFDDVRAVIEADIGRPLSAVFAHFEETPLAAASIAQVHAARLHTGEEVVVKVQRPQVAALVREDITTLSWLAPFFVGRIPVAALANPPALVELFAETILEELDFRLEASNMLDIAAVLARTDQRAIIVPRPHPTLVTKRVMVMERLSGFSFDDVEGMRAAGIDTAALLRAGLISFLEGALLYGVFHGDLHGGNLFVLPDGRTALLDFGITGRLDDSQRLAFLRLLLGGAGGDVRSQLEALRDLGAFPRDTDIDAVIADLELDGPVKDPTKMSADELTSELRDLTKKLLGYGARAPKQLMLFVKNMVFLDGATVTLAPDLDILAEIMHVFMYFQEHHGARLAAELGLDPEHRFEIDMGSVRGAMGIADEIDSLTYADVKARRDLIAQRMQGRKRRQSA
ncbi:MAG: ABC1 kinase family protein [Actinomycetes bacterium]